MSIHISTRQFSKTHIFYPLPIVIATRDEDTPKSPRSSSRNRATILLGENSNSHLIEYPVAEIVKTEQDNSNPTGEADPFLSTNSDSYWASFAQTWGYLSSLWDAVSRNGDPSANS